MSLSRRQFLGRAAGAGVAVTVAGSVEALYAAEPALGTSGPDVGYGPLVEDPAGVLDLPRGFRYKILSREGTVRPDGLPVPSRFDGMGVFADRRGGSRLVRNHECSPTSTIPVRGPAELTYDPAAAGGTSTLTVDRHGNTSEHISVAGTAINCSGGRTPWHTWLTCEENEDKAGANGYTKDHGFNFEVDPHDERNNRNPTPLKAMGRFQHEAVAVDPQTGIVYETEDAFIAPLGSLYRFLPERTHGGYGSLRAGGELQILHVPGLTDTSVVQEPGTTFRGVEWMTVPDPLATTVSVRAQDYPKPVTRGFKFEGAWWGVEERCLFFVSSFARTTSGSVRDHDGQVWRYDPGRGTLRLEIVFTRPSPGSDNPEFDAPDNICMSPYGGLMMCEDGIGDAYMLGTTRHGEVFHFARNRVNLGTPEEPSYGELSGVGFSADGRTMFFNIYEPGITFAVTGPWNRRHD
jgi:uncharacterized protein